jgi:hypothetical protein
VTLNFSQCFVCCMCLSVVSLTEQGSNYVIREFDLVQNNTAKYSMWEGVQYVVSHKTEYPKLHNVTLLSIRHRMHYDITVSEDCIT